MPVRRTLLGLLLVASSAFNQQIPIVNPTAGLPNEKLQTEFMEVYRLGAGPSAIHRKPGRFFLLVSNQSKDANASFSLAPQGTSLVPPLTIGGPLTWLSSHKLAAIVDAAVPGVWLLKSNASGQTLCTITISE